MAANEGSTAPELGAHLAHKWAAGLYRLSSPSLADVRNRIDELGAHIDALASVGNGEDFSTWNDDIQRTYRWCMADRAHELRVLLDAASDIQAIEREAAERARNLP